MFVHLLLLVLIPSASQLYSTQTDERPGSSSWGSEGGHTTQRSPPFDLLVDRAFAIFYLFLCVYLLSHLTYKTNVLLSDKEKDFALDYLILYCALDYLILYCTGYHIVLLCLRQGLMPYRSR